MASKTYTEIYNATVDYLKSSSSIQPSASKSNKDIVAALRQRIGEGKLAVDVTDGTILNYLSQAANNDPDSEIVSGGPRGGYWYEEAPVQQSVPEVEDQTEVQATTGGKVKLFERDLYPLMELWLEKKGYRSRDMSSLKAGGRWGNPDIIGVDRVEVFGAVQIDLVSCEIKLSDSNWEQVIFEAISHKRFCNRSWFCYRVASDAQPLPKGIEYYAERYRVGVVQIFLTDEELISLKQGSSRPLDHIDRVEERVPALYDYVPLGEQSDVIDRTGISLTVTF